MSKSDTPRGQSQTERSERSLRAPIISIIIALVLGTAAGYFWVLPALQTSQADWIAPSTDQARVQGRILYDQYCASCHGVNLEGQPNWRDRMANGRLPAPPHDVSGHTWHHPDDELRSLIRDGLVPGVTAPAGYESDMPAYGGILTNEQIDLILAYIKGYWPEDALQAQREITVNSWQKRHASGH